MNKVLIGVGRSYAMSLVLLRETPTRQELSRYSVFGGVR